ncbi:MAG: SDR family oxidoreductase [Limnobacter sp.]|nr:SDR family oxidoreductase [Limnobacter sp.]
MRAIDARVLLTGASGGIGRAGAQALTKAGAAVMLTGRSAEALAALADEIRDTRPRTDVQWHDADLTRSADIAALSAAAQAWNVNVLVNNAGQPSFGPFSEFEPAHVEQVLRTNLLAPILLTHAMLPWLARRPAANVIQVGSVLGRLALPGFSVYSAGKFGLRGFSEALRRELAGSGVRVQYLGPRSTRTRFNDAAVLAYNEATGTAMDEPARVAAALVELLESDAAERFLGFPESLAARVNGLAPTLVDGGLRRHRAALAGPRTEATRVDPAPATSESSIESSAHRTPPSRR